MIAIKSAGNYQRLSWLIIFIFSYLAYEIWEHWPVGLRDLELQSLALVLTEAAFVVMLILFAHGLARQIRSWDKRGSPRTFRAAGILSRKPRVLVVGTETLLGAGIENLLRKAGQVEVVGVSLAREGQFLDRITKEPPDLIVVSADSELNTLRILQELPAGSHARLVSIGMNPGEARVYDLSQVVLQGAADLVRIISDS